MPKVREREELSPQAMAESQNLPVPVPNQEPAPRAEPEEERSAGLFTQDGPGLQVLVFGSALFSALAAGAAHPAGGLAVLPVGLLTAVIVDFILWRQQELRHAA